MIGAADMNWRPVVSVLRDARWKTWKVLGPKCPACGLRRSVSGDGEHVSSAGSYYEDMCVWMTGHYYMFHAGPEMWRAA